MKTPIQEVYENFNLMSDADFKAWMLNTDLLEKEKEVIMKTYNHAALHGILVEMGNTEIVNAEEYYNKTFKTK